MRSKQDRKMARLMTARVIEFRGGWKKGVSRSDRRKYRKQIYQAILNNIEKMNNDLFIWLCSSKDSPA